MNRTIVRIAAWLVVLFVPALGAVAANEAPPAHAAGKAVLVPSSELKWTDVKDFPGVKMATIQGDPNKGSSHFFIKLPAGFNAPLHFHNADHWVAVVSGSLVLTPEGGAETQLPAGSAFGFTGKKNHTTKCAEGADCVLFLDCRGKWDVIPVEKK